MKMIVDGILNAIARITIITRNNIAWKFGL